MSNNLRSDKLKWLFIAMSNATDEQIIDIFNIFSKEIEYTNNAVDRQLAVSHIVDNIIMTKDTTIDELYKHCEESNLLFDNGIYITKARKKKFQLDDNKYNITLNIVNEILEIIGRQRIGKLEDFQHIKRDELDNYNCKQMIIKNIDYITLQYKKKDIRYNNKDQINIYAVTTIKGLVKKLDGYEFISKNHKHMKTPDGVKKVNYTTYSIGKL